MEETEIVWVLRVEEDRIMLWQGNGATCRDTEDGMDGWGWIGYVEKGHDTHDRLKERKEYVIRQ